MPDLAGNPNAASLTPSSIAVLDGFDGPRSRRAAGALLITL
jgi:hypothetical protein